MFFHLIKDARRTLKWRLAVLLVLLVLTSLFEGLGLSMLFPVLARFGIGQQSSGALQAATERAIAALHIPNELGPLLSVVVGLLVLQVLIQTGKGWVEADCQTRYAADWQRRIFAAFINADWQFFTSHKSTTLVSTITLEAQRVTYAFYLAVQLATSAVFVLVYAVISIAAAWQLVVLIAIFGALAWALTRRLSRRGVVIGRRLTMVNADLQHRTTEFLQSAKLIKVTASEELAKSMFAQAADSVRVTYRLSGFQPKLVFGGYMAFGYLLLGFAVWLAVARLGLEPTAVLVSIFVFLRLYVQLTNFQQCRQGFLLSAPALDVVLAQVQSAHQQAETLTGSAVLPSGAASIRLEAITVRFGDLAALNDVSLTVPAGAHVGVTGSSGAGKSTLVDVIVNLARPSAGAVFVDGMPLTTVSLADWRRSIGYVAQETLLLNASIATNIAWGGDYDRGAIESAARAANAHEFIMALPKGYDTPIGERGVRLSGGQRQRLGLARALIGDKRVLILDEATSALDSESEREIISALAQMYGKVTILSVAHRLSTLRNADKIVLLDKGRLVEEGNWEELGKQNGMFARLLRLQEMHEHASAVEPK